MRILLRPIREWIRPDVTDPAARGHLIYATLLHLFTVSLGVRKLLCPIRRWIQPDVSDPAVWCHLVYTTFLHLFAQNVWVLGPCKGMDSARCYWPSCVMPPRLRNLFTQNERVRIILGPIREWIYPDISYNTAWCHHVYRYGDITLRYHNNNITWNFTIFLGAANTNDSKFLGIFFFIRKKCQMYPCLLYSVSLILSFFLKNYGCILNPK